MSVNSASPETSYLAFVEMEARNKLFAPLLKIDSTKTAFLQYRLEAKVLKHVDNELTCTLLRYSFRKTLSYLKAKNQRELYWLLKKEIKDLAHLLPKMSTEDAKSFISTRSLLTMRPDARAVVEYLHSSTLGDREERKENWITSIAKNIFLVISREFSKLPGEKRIDKIILEVEYAHLSDLETIISRKEEIIFNDECSTCKSLQTTLVKIQRCKCRKVFYCDRECQRIDYPQHSKICFNPT